MRSDVLLIMTSLPCDVNNG